MRHSDSTETPRRSAALRLGLLGAILVVAALPRGNELGSASFWFDEVVTMRLAETADPPALIDLLGRIDATRAPLQPLMLQLWVKVFGRSEVSGRSFSVACGLLTVAMVYRIGRRGFDDPRAGLWAAWLAALSPQLVYYSREVRMYALLVLVSCAAWDALLSLRESSSAMRLAGYAATLAALVYTHPLGLFMVGSVGLAALIFRREFGLSWGRWLAVHLLAALAVAPWLGRYLDHPPDFLSGRLPIRFLVGTPIGFIGGNFLTLAGFAAVIAFGIVRLDRGADGRIRAAIDAPAVNASLLIWLALAPTMLYVYSWARHPIFGPPRYTIFVAPAYLILVGRGLSKLPLPAAAVVAIGAAALSVSMWPRLIFAPDAKADWRAAAAMLDRIDPQGREPVVVIARGPTGTNFEDDTARYYFGSKRPVLAMPARLDEVAGRLGFDSDRNLGPVSIWFSVGVRDGRPILALPDGLVPSRAPIVLNGLLLVPVDPHDLP